MTNGIYPSEISDSYERLEINKDSTQEEIKKAYRELALAWHPDRNPSNRERAHIEFIAVSEAFEDLCAKKDKRLFQKSRSSSGGETRYDYYEKVFDMIFKDLDLSPILSLQLKTILKAFKEFSDL